MINLQSSKIKFINIVLKNFEMQLINIPDDEQINIAELFNSYEFDIKPTVVHEGASVTVTVQASINRGEDRKPGYSIYAELCCMFEFDKTKYMEKKDRESFIHSSSVNITMSTLRTYLVMHTSNSPFGKYILPLLVLHPEIKKSQAKKNI